MPRVAKEKADDRVDLLSRQVSELTEKLNAVLDAPAPVRHVAPVARSGAVDSGDLNLPSNEGAVEFSPTALEMIRPELEVPDGPVARSQMEELAFNEEYVDVMVHESDSPDAEPLVEVFNNGARQIFPRGQVVTCRRKYLEGLIRSKPVSYSNVEFVREDGVRAVKYPKRSSLRYPFQVVRDDNPRGVAWLKKLMAQAA
jgi:hypothetical protein